MVCHLTLRQNEETNSPSNIYSMACAHHPTPHPIVNGRNGTFGAWAQQRVKCQAF